jgi:hypothetical protein
VRRPGQFKESCSKSYGCRNCRRLEITKASEGRKDRSTNLLTRRHSQCWTTSRSLNTKSIHPITSSFHFLFVQWKARLSSTFLFDTSLSSSIGHIQMCPHGPHNPAPGSFFFVFVPLFPFDSSQPTKLPTQHPRKAYLCLLGFLNHFSLTPLAMQYKPCLISHSLNTMQPIQKSVVPPRRSNRPPGVPLFFSRCRRRFSE